MDNKKNTFSIKTSLVKGASFVSDLLSHHAEDEKSIRTLVYHNVTDNFVPDEWQQMTTPRDLFEEQMRYLAENGYKTLSAYETYKSLVSKTGIPSRSICITFDDGYRDNYRNAFPVLEKYGLKATIFLTTGFVGKRNTSTEYLTWQDIDEMRKSKVFEIGCHSLSHRNLAGLESEDLTEEIGQAKRVTEDKNGGKIDTFAYPFGWQNAFDDKVINAVKDAGFSCAFTAIHGANTKQTDLFRLRRIRISWLNEIDEFQKVLRGSYDWYSIYQKAFSLCKKVR